MGFLCLCAVAAVELSRCRVACAQEVADAPPEDGRELAAPLAGVATAVLPFIAGSLMVAQDDNPARQRDGVRLMTYGFAAAPWVSHAVAGRWKRALVFGLASVAASTATLLAMEARDPFDPAIGNRKRLAFGFLFTASFFLAAGGVADSFVVGPDPRDR
ncbi:MAG TPA: hypothetical protein VHU40_22715 [Polyangia bacterium]|nr:hypothetical protein [Polyangia bacterium]